MRLQIEEDLRVNRIKGTVTGRPKHYYSIYQKMIVRDKKFDDIYDFVSLYIIKVFKLTIYIPLKNN